MHVRIPDDDKTAALVERLVRERAVTRLHRRDATLFGPPGTPEVSDRLGWLDLPGAMAATVDALRKRLPRAERVFLIGMGGSSLAPEVFWRASGASAHIVVDTTHPVAVARALDAVRPGDVVIAASKSGTTVETRTVLDLMHARHGSQATFIAITDPGTPLETWAQEHECDCLNAPPDVGGRFSALSVFGLAPAVAGGLDPEHWIPALSDAVSACRPDHADNPALRMAAALAAAWHQERDVLLIRDHPELPLYPWIEQLVAESLGKDGIGLIPLEAAGQPDSVSRPAPCRLRCGPALSADDADIALTLRSREDIAAAMYVFEVATALAGFLLGVQPFDQPNVERAKVLAREAMAGARPPLQRASGNELQAWIAETPEDHCLVVQAFIDPAELHLAKRLAQDIGVQRSIWLNAAPGPRYLHASGQLHKARPSRFSFLNLVDTPVDDIDIPGRGFSLAQLLRAQADGDVTALREVGARIFAGHWNDIRELAGAADDR